MLKFILLGCGRISEKHSQLLGTNKIKGASLVGVCDINLSKAKKIADIYKVPYFDNIHSLMNKVDADVIVILTPSGFHASNILEVIKYKKHIVVEKPMTLTVEDAEKVILECDRAKVKLFVVKQNRFNLAIKKLKNAIETNKFGKIFLATVRVRWARHQSYYDQDKWRGTWKYDGGVIANQASHHVDLLEWMMGDVESVFAKSKQSIANIETEDTAIAILNFKNKSLGIIEATTAARPNNIEGSISILGEKGTAVIGGIAVDKINTWRFENEEKNEKDIISKFSNEVDHVYGIGHQLYYEHIVDCINNGSAQLVDGLEGKKSIELINSIYESIEIGKEIYIKSNFSKTKLGN